jgi:hypothetical protein
LAVWKRKAAAKRDEASEILERLEWFDRPELARRKTFVTPPPRASVVEEARPARRAADWSLPVPPWEARPEVNVPETPAETPEAPEPAAAPETFGAPEQSETPEPSEPKARPRWLVAPPRPVAPLIPRSRRTEPGPAPTDTARAEALNGPAGESVATPPVSPRTMRVYRGRLRPALLGLVALAISGAFIFAVSSLDSPDSSTQPPKAPAPKSAAPKSAAPVPGAKPAQNPPTKRPAAPAKTSAKPKPKANAKPSVVPAPKPATKPAAPPKTNPPTSAPPPATAAALPPFAWTTVAGASGYEFELFRGPKLVYSARTQTPGITVPSTWTKSGHFYQVEPGRYRWYVWAIVGGERRTKAIVQATLDVPAP